MSSYITSNALSLVHKYTACQVYMDKLWCACEIVSYHKGEMWPIKIYDSVMYCVMGVFVGRQTSNPNSTASVCITTQYTSSPNFLPQPSLLIWPRVIMNHSHNTVYEKCVHCKTTGISIIIYLTVHQSLRLILMVFQSYAGTGTLQN